MSVSLFERTNIAVDEMPDVVKDSVTSLIEVEKEVNAALNKAEQARETAIANGSQRVGLIFGHKKNIESINQAICKISDATGELAASQTIMLEYMKKLSEVTSFLFKIGVSNIAANRAVIGELEKQLKNASTGKLSPLARDELKATIAQLKAQQDFMSKQEQTHSELKILESRLSKSSRDLAYEQQQAKAEINEIKNELSEKSQSLIEQINSLIVSGEEQNELVACISRTLDSHNKSISGFSDYNDQQDDCINFLYENIQNMNISLQNIAFSLNNLNSRIDVIGKFISEQESYITFLYSQKKAHDSRITELEKQIKKMKEIDAEKALALINAKVNEMNNNIKNQTNKIDELETHNKEQDNLINHICRGGKVVPKS